MFKKKRGTDSLLKLFDSNSPYIQCFGLSAARSLAAREEHYTSLCKNGIFSKIEQVKMFQNYENLRELGGLMFNLTFYCDEKKNLFCHCMEKLKFLLESDDCHLIRQAISTYGNLFEDASTLETLVEMKILQSISMFLKHTNVDVQRESMRAISNILTVCKFHEQVTKHSLNGIISLANTTDNECLYCCVLGLRKIAMYRGAHSSIVSGAIPILLPLANKLESKTASNLIMLLRELSGNPNFRFKLVEYGLIDYALSMTKLKCMNTQAISVSMMRHISEEHNLTPKIVDSGAVKVVVRLVSRATNDLRCQISGLLANLSENCKNHILMVEEGVISAITIMHRFENNETQLVRLLDLVIFLDEHLFTYSFFQQRIVRD